MGKVSENNFSGFTILKALVYDEKYNIISANIQKNIRNHRKMLVDEFNRYFLEYNNSNRKVSKS